MLVFEELSLQLTGKLADPDILFMIEYSEGAQAAEISVAYNGDLLNILKISDPLPLSVINGVAAEPEYSYTDNTERGNRLVFRGVG